MIGGYEMKIIKYTLNGNAVSMTWNEANENIARKEADNGAIAIEEVEDDVKNI